ncbi:MAG: ATP-dependent DNA helicase RecG [Alphaproteobacteria bacterium]|nr:ATP-dependent DNA helicase RecG [Alphaproteobacteria bacterium]QQS56110.1 MAG: ATP-dependent DNA helicase RecG [Alphaproteobacteria bacterium]
MSRPFDLDPLFRSLVALPGIGPRNAKLMENLVGGPKVLDLLFHAPVDFVDRRFSGKISDVPNGRVVTLTVRVGKHSPNARKNLPYRVQCLDESGVMMLVFFHANKVWIEKQLPEGQTVIVSGRVEYFQGQPQMVHPDAVGKVEDRAAIERIEPIYPLTQGITNKLMNKSVAAAERMIPALPEWLDEAYQAQQKWPGWKEALTALHHPESEKDLNPLTPCRARLAYDELLANQLTLLIVREHQRVVEGRSHQVSTVLREKVLAALPFQLTGAQKRSLAEIDEDMQKPQRMLRLLHGDVGSGKTIVACLAMLNAVESGKQAALMTPTEILARQHAETLSPYLQAAGVRAVILTGRDKGKTRETLLQQIRNGAAQVIIGTHAIFQKDVVYQDLGLAVIDEQHRFGVQQRLELSTKNHGIDLLVMTATPIPRTLALTAYGDLDVSKLDEKPPGRKPIDTLLLPSEKMEMLIERLKNKIKEGNRVYWVCPLVEESELIDLAAAEERYDVLRQVFGERTGMIHGRMKPADKDAVMEKFIAGDLDILVATTVIEVGVNVPAATIMVIEHAERFGLAQLHQLRGRVGRGADQSYCFLLYSGPLGETAKARLSTLRETEDGFVIAEKDLHLRGAGDLLGLRQSGMAEFRLADLSAHGELLAAARDDAKLILAKDPTLKSKRGEALRTLLYLFERDQAIAYFQSG